MLVTAAQIDVEHHDLARVRIDEQLLDLAELATAHGAHFPATDVGLAVGAVPLSKITKSNEPLRVSRIRPDTGRVALPVAMTIRHVCVSRGEGDVAGADVDAPGVAPVLLDVAPRCVAKYQIAMATMMSRRISIQI